MFGTLQKDAWAREAASRTNVNALFMARDRNGVLHAEAKNYLSGGASNVDGTVRSQASGQNHMVL